jgi:hypothetical protein
MSTGHPARKRTRRVAGLLDEPGKTAELRQIAQQEVLVFSFQLHITLLALRERTAFFLGFCSRSRIRSWRRMEIFATAGPTGSPS